jgi:hypothetical protein
MRNLLIVFLIVVASWGVAQQALVPPASQQIAEAVLPLPEPMRSQATVIGYGPDRSFLMLREGKNGMVCTANRPGVKSLTSVVITHRSCR